MGCAQISKGGGGGGGGGGVCVCVCVGGGGGGGAVVVVVGGGGGSNVTNEPSVSDWVVQVPLWPSGLGIGLWSERPGVVGGGGGGGGGWGGGVGGGGGGSNVTNEPSVSDWVVQVPLWPSGLGIGLWSERPGVRSPYGPLH